MRLMHENISYLVGTNKINDIPLKPFSEIICSFLNDLSHVLRKCVKAKTQPDVQAFAFWIRKSNINRLKKRAEIKQVRIGRGIVFHIAPSNVPTNFVYTLVFGMLSGNSNIVRVSSVNHPQVKILCDCINEVLKTNYAELKKKVCIIRYNQNKDITDFFSSICNARVIWGGDSTIQEIRKSPIMPRTTEVTFADRFSFAIINPESIIIADEFEIKRLAQCFYNDTFLMDQNGCSSPHIILWKKLNGIETQKASTRFWEAIYDVAKSKYNLDEAKVSNKFAKLYNYFAVNDNVIKFKKFDNLLYIVTLSKLSSSLDDFNGKFGLFYEYEFENYDAFSTLINEKIQTCAFFGFTREEIVDVIIKHSLKGIDRVVPFGKTLEIDLFWDGYDVIGNLSRVIG